MYRTRNHTSIPLTLLTDYAQTLTQDQARTRVKGALRGGRGEHSYISRRLIYETTPQTSRYWKPRCAAITGHSNMPCTIITRCYGTYSDIGNSRMVGWVRLNWLRQSAHNPRVRSSGRRADRIFLKCVEITFFLFGLGVCWIPLCSCALT